MNIEMDEKLMKGIHENHLKAQKKEQSEKQQEEEGEKKLAIIVLIVGIIMSALFVLLLIEINKGDEEAIQNCMQQGISEYQCTREVKGFH